MKFIEVFIIAIALAMDAFAASVSKGICIKNISKKQCGLIALFFGGFQSIMPLLGYFLGIRFVNVINKFDYIIGFAMLFIIGTKMIIEAILTKEDGEYCKINYFKIKDILFLAIATSIDALAIGVAFSLTVNNIFIPSIIIGVTTFFLSIVGIYIGKSFGSKYEKRAEVFGGIILITLGFRMLITHFI